MTRTSQSNRFSILTRSALGAALALGVAGGALTSAPAEAQRGRQQQQGLKLSPAFQAAAVPLNQGIEAAKTRPDVVAAKQRATEAGNAFQRAPVAQREQARSAHNAAIAALGNTLANEKAQLDAVFAAVTGADDKFTAGQLAVTLGGLAQDPAIQLRGLNAMIESGKAAPADLPRLQFFVGQLSFDQRNYAAARTAFQAAIAGGYHENDADALLAEAYIADNQVPQGLDQLKRAIEQRRAAGQPAPVGWYRRGLGAAYKAKLMPQATDFSMGLIQAYPTTENWAGAISVVREVGQYQSQENLDLMRLMARTNSYMEEHDYIEHIQAADPRRLPGEAMKVIEAGTAAGKLRSGDPFVTEARTIASGRLAADRASLPGLEREARAAGATAAGIAGSADAFLSYGEAAKAEALYTLALTKPGVDNARVLTRLGIAQADQGKYAEAQATFARVEGPRKPMAQLWATYAAQKAGGGARPAG